MRLHRYEEEMQFDNLIYLAVEYSRWCSDMLPVLLLSVLLLAFSGCIQPEKPAVVTEKEATEMWKADGVVGESEYSRSMLLQGPARQGYSGGDMEVSWKNDGDYLYLALNGSTEGWLAIGFEPLEWMKDADMIMGSVNGGKATVQDEYCTGNYGPHIEDHMLGGTNDIEEYGGSKIDGRTIIELKRKLDTSDRFDKAFKPGQAVSIIWALSGNEDKSIKHNLAYGEGIMTLTERKNASSVAALNSREKEGLIFIWEEEKTARDLYTALHEKNDLTIFQNLAGSEQNHMDQAQAVIDQYELIIPGSDVPGVFQNESLQRVYDLLLAEGLSSDQDALKAAAAFEEISIMDLETELNATENIRIVYQGLLAGSRKHLRSYVSDLHDLGMEYVPRYMGQSEFEEIVRAG
jgi:hypothetical protein